MEQNNAAQDRTEYVNNEIQKAVDARGGNADFAPVTQIGKGEDAYLTTTITFIQDATAQEVAEVKRSLPMSFDKELRTDGNTLAISVQVQTA